MTLQQLRDFLAVIEHGGFRAAARALDVSQGGLTKSIAKLEDDYSAILVRRDAKGLQLTPEGEALAPMARAVIVEADRASNWLRQSSEKQRPAISVGVSIDPALRLAPTVFSDFRRSNPNVALHLTHSVTSDLLMHLRDNRIELALVRLSGTPDPALSEDLHIEPLYEGEPVVLARSGHPLNDVASVAVLNTYDWIVVGGAPDEKSGDASLVEIFDRYNVGRPRVAAYSSSLFDAVSLLLHSDYLARLPLVVLHHPLVKGKLKPIKVSEHVRPYTVALVYKSGRKLSREAQLLCAMISSFVRIDNARKGLPNPAAPAG
ncbi:LysR family transcriptional regulator [Achromobacter sp. NPDC058515]|uniref:LysR family transcriptional regulator n=1 Tax=Achromobacter sp. NPDC058515 TaxID=3346533 RepID=UPI0036689456